MLEFKKTAPRQGTLTLSRLRVAKFRRALYAHLRNLGLPRLSAKHVADTALSRRFGYDNLRLYRLNTSHYIFVEYIDGIIFVGTVEEIFDYLLERKYRYDQIRLWVQMANTAAEGGIMSEGAIRHFIVSNNLDRSIFTFNVAPKFDYGLSSRMQKWFRKRGKSFLRFPDDFI